MEELYKLLGEKLKTRKNAYILKWMLIPIFKKRKSQIVLILASVLIKTHEVFKTDSK